MLTGTTVSVDMQRTWDGELQAYLVHGWTYSIHFTSDVCGLVLPELQVLDARNMTVMAPTAATFNAAAGGAQNVAAVGWNATVSRPATSAPPLGGHFELGLRGQMETLSYDVTAEQMKAAIEKMTDTENTAGIEIYDRRVSVYRSDVLWENKCGGFSWDVSFETDPGDVPMMTVYGDQLTGRGARVTVTEFLKGRMALTALPTLVQARSKGGAAAHGGGKGEGAGGGGGPPCPP